MAAGMPERLIRRTFYLLVFITLIMLLCVLLDLHASPQAWPPQMTGRERLATPSFLDEQPAPPVAPRPRRSASDVRPFIGTSGDGHTAPGAHRPFGMIYLNPINLNPAAANSQGAYSSGYQRTDGKFWGVAHTALSGAGIVLGQDVVVSPFGQPAWIDKASEVARVGYYSASLAGDMSADRTAPTTAAPTAPKSTRKRPQQQEFDPSYGEQLQRIRSARKKCDAKCRALAETLPPPSPPPPPSPTDPSHIVALELAAGIRYGIHRYTFHEAVQPRLYIKLANGRLLPPLEWASNGNRLVAAYDRGSARKAPFVAQCAIDGRQESGVGNHWASYTTFFYAELNAPCNLTRRAASWIGKGMEHSLRLAFGGPQSHQLEMHIAVSYVSQRGAWVNFAHEHTSWAALRASTTIAWEEAMGTVVAEHATAQEKVIFDTALYHAFTAPYTHSDADVMPPEQRSNCWYMTHSASRG